MNNSNKKSAKTVKRMRYALCLGINEFGELLGSSKQAVWQYEKGLRNPRMQTIRKFLAIAKKNHIEVTLEDFLN